MVKYSDMEQKFRYEVRNETEQSVKDLNIDRKNFHEAPKNEWESIIKRFYYTFIDYNNYPNIHLNYLWLHFRDDLTYTNHIRYGFHSGDWIEDWIEFVGHIDDIIPKEGRPAEYYYINNSGWVYEGKLPEVMKIIGDSSGMVEDFYILPKREKFDWVVCYCGDGDCMGIYLRG